MDNNCPHLYTCKCLSFYEQDKTVSRLDGVLIRQKPAIG